MPTSQPVGLVRGTRRSTGGVLSGHSEHEGVRQASQCEVTTGVGSGTVGGSRHAPADCVTRCFRGRWGVCERGVRGAGSTEGGVCVTSFVIEGRQPSVGLHGVMTYVVKEFGGDTNEGGVTSGTT